jgi:hypothetical protein
MSFGPFVDRKSHDDAAYIAPFGGNIAEKPYSL